MWDFLTIFDSSGFPPRWSCGNWSPALGWLHILSDATIAAAYFVIPCVFGYYTRRRKDIPFRGVLYLFGAFILLCGLTHLMDAVLFWWPAYRLDGVLKVLTAAVSWATVVALVRVTPHLMALRSPADLERQIAGRTAAVAESEARFRAVFDATPAGLVIAGRDGRIVLVNDTLARMFGWDKGELIGRPVERLLPARYQERHPALRDSYFAAPSERAMGAGRDLMGTRKDGTEFPVEVGLRPVEMGGAVFALASVIDITARKQVEAKLQASEEQFRTAVDAAPNGMALVAADGRFIRVNGSLCEMLGYSEAELLATDFQSVTHPDDLEADLALAEELLAGRRATYHLEKRYLRKDGHVVHAVLSVSLVRNADGSPLYAIKQVQDVTARKQAEADLRASEERFQAFMDHAPVAAWMVDEDLRGVYASPGFDRLTGLAPGSLLGRTPAELFPAETAARQIANDTRVLDTGRAVGDEEDLVGADGTLGVAYVVKFPVPGPNGSTLIGSVAIDITERKRAEELVKASLREKEVLLKEIHHRVKNNLQIVSTLLDLQSGHTADREAKAMFQESRGRVKSMALIHERLYRSGDLARVDFAEYTRRLARDLFGTYRVTEGIRLELAVDIPPLPIDIAIPCGLLLNELVSNCLKHAFKGAAEGCVRVALRRDGTVNELVVADDGVGFPAGTDFRNTTSFGLQLATTLAEQLGGEIHMTADRGTAFTVRFPTPVDPPATGTRP